jgi:hypothetical protein
MTLPVVWLPEADAEQFPVVHRKFRRAGVRRFPFGIFFEVQESRVVVIACLQAGVILSGGRCVVDR